MNFNTEGFFYYLEERDGIEEGDVDSGELLEEEQSKEDYDGFVARGFEKLLEFRHHARTPQSLRL